ncbi:MAG: 5,6-dimethylbenzimidazole synthase, partial [bacterium]
MQKRIFLEKKRNFDSIIMDEVMGNRIFTSEESQILEDIMIHRRDVRGNQFIGKEIPSDVLNKILFSAQVAPSVGFSQPWKFVIVQKQEIKQKILNSFQEENDSAANQFEGGRKDQYQKLKLEGIMEAPVNIAVFYEPSDHPVLGQTSMKEVGLYSVV